MNIRPRLMHRAFVVVMAMVLPVLAGVMPAQAASWVLVASPNATGNDGLAAVTAISPTDLWAVGLAYSLSSSSAPLIENYNGSAWHIVASPNPAGGRYDNLSGVSGTSASDVWGVGNEFINSTHSYPLIEHYNGTAWSLSTSAAPTQHGYLDAVAALTPASVWAAGTSKTSAGVWVPMVQHYDGTAWTEPSAPAISGGELGAMTAVSATDIWAVGSQSVTTGIGRSGLALHYDGTGWTAVTLPAPAVPGSGEWELYSVSASSASDVWAAGFVSDATGLDQHAIAEHYNGTSWTVTQAPDLDASHPINAFNSVLDLSPGNVWAMGVSATGNENVPPVALVEHFDGTSWTVQPAPTLSGNTISLGSLVTTGSGTLWAVGDKLPAGSSAYQVLTARYS